MRVSIRPAIGGIQVSDSVIISERGVRLWVRGNASQRSDSDTLSIATQALWRQLAIVLVSICFRLSLL